MTKITRYLAISGAITFSVVLYYIFEKYNNTYFSITDIQFIENLESTFTIVFVLIFPILFINYFVISKVKYIIYFIVFISILSYIYFNIFIACSITSVIVKSLIHGSSISIFLILNYMLFQKIKIKTLFYILFLVICMLSLFLPYYVSVQQNTSNEKIKSEELVNIGVGEILSKIRMYRITEIIKDKKEDLDTLQKSQDIFLQIDIDLLVSSPDILNKLKEKGYCKNWNNIKKLQRSKFSGAEFIDKVCEGI